MSISIVQPLVHRWLRPIGYFFSCLILWCIAQTTAFAVTPVTMIAAGEGHSCSLDSNGAVKCWGQNTYGQLGNGTTINSKTPVQVTGLTSGVKAIAAGAVHTCAINGSGAVRCWGNNIFSQLGDGTTVNSSIPVQVTGLTSDVKAIAAGTYHTCAIDGSGAAQCWGYNDSDQLGNGTMTDSSTPVQITGLTSGVKAVTGGTYHTCAIDGSGAAQCWGSNGYGQLGDGTTTNSGPPVQVTGLTSGVKAIAGGLYHVCAIDTNGAAKCWGRNHNGQLGDGTTVNSSTPVQVTGLTNGMEAITGGLYHVCAIDTNGAVKCWGQNIYGQLGNGTTINSKTPVQVTGLTSGVKTIAIGNFHTCAIDGNGAVKCWGRNSFGQLGDATTSNSNTPVTVDFKSPQTITLGTAPSVTYAGTGAVSATATSNLAVTFSSQTPSVCTVSGTTVTAVAIGTCTIAADQAGDADYKAAPQVMQSFTIAKANQSTLTATTSSNSIIIGGTTTLGSTGGSGTGAVTYTSNNANCTISGSTLTAAAVGSCTVTATKAADSNYTQTTATVNLTVASPSPPVTPSVPKDGSAGNTADAGQELLIVGGTVLIAGSKGSQVNATSSAGVSTVSVTTGSTGIPCSVATAFCKPSQTTLHVLAGETVKFTADGKVINIQINPTAPTSEVPRLNGQSLLDAIIATLRADSPSLGSETGRKVNDWSALNVDFSSGKLSVAVQLPMQVNPAQPDGVQRLPNGVTRVTTQGVIVNLAPTLVDASRFNTALQAIMPSAQMRTNADGTTVVSYDHAIYSFRPNLLTTGADTSDFTLDTSGNLRFGNQGIPPAAYSFDQFLGMLKEVAPTTTAQIQSDGKLAVTIQGTTYILTPDYQVTTSPTVSGTTGFEIRNGKLFAKYLFGFTQGFGVGQ